MKEFTVEKVFPSKKCQEIRDVSPYFFVFFCGLSISERTLSTGGFLIILRDIDAMLPPNEINEAQEQPAFEKPAEVIPCRLDFFVVRCLELFLIFSWRVSRGHHKSRMTLLQCRAIN